MWPPSFALARAYLDQLERSKGLGSEAIAAARTTLASAERASGSQRKPALTQLAAKVKADDTTRDQAKVSALSTALIDLANTQR